MQPCALRSFARPSFPQVWSNGDVVVNSGGKGMSPSTLVILNLVLGVFKVEVRAANELLRCAAAAAAL